MKRIQDLSPFVFGCDFHGGTIPIDINGMFILGENCRGNSWQNVLKINKLKVFD